MDKPNDLTTTIARRAAKKIIRSKESYESAEWITPIIADAIRPLTDASFSVLSKLAVQIDTFHRTKNAKALPSVPQLQLLRERLAEGLGRSDLKRIGSAFAQMATEGEGK